ncbi:N-acetylmuramoyl-L-alanine amidase [Bernardetia sp. Wsw4-3y2]|uniref:N-acetylmuramoyl-L-alanine amidase family protein n=1 Tax=Bernardetia sp. Wsw4-3y2 TaxID=3127471 RepID=UPI0030CDBCE9
MIWRSIKSILFWLGILENKNKDVIIDDEIIIEVPIVIEEDKPKEKEPIEVLIEEIEKEQNDEKEIVKNNPNKNNLVIFRIGHGLNTSGKETPMQDDGTIIKEYQLNKWIVEKAIPMLESLGYECIIANPYDYENADAKKALNIVVGHVNRITKEAWGQHKNVICLDVHCNAHQIDENKIEFTSASGTASFYWEVKNKEGEVIKYSKKGKKLAIAIHEQMVKRTGLPDRVWSFNRGKAIGWNYQMVRDTICPTVTIECAFMTNRGDLEYLKSEEGQKTIATAIAIGVDNYFNKNK